MSKNVILRNLPVMTVTYFRSLYLSSSICQYLQRDLNGRHDSEWVIVAMRGLDRIRKFGFFWTSDMVQHDCVSNKH